VVHVFTRPATRVGGCMLCMCPDGRPSGRERVLHFLTSHAWGHPIPYRSAYGSTVPTRPPCFDTTPAGCMWCTWSDGRPWGQGRVLAFLTTHAWEHPVPNRSACQRSPLDHPALTPPLKGWHLGKSRCPIHLQLFPGFGLRP
jgi:hypothetical protein